MNEPITEQWLSESGFKWHQLDRQPHKHWLLWIGDCLHEHGYTDPERLGVELTQDASKDTDGWWYCWLRSDTAGRYSRFVHVRHLRTTDELIQMIEGLTGQTWMPINNLYGAMHRPQRAAWLRQEAERLDQRWLREGHPWREIEKDDTRGGALPEHLQAAVDTEKAQ